MTHPPKLLLLLLAVTMLAIGGCSDTKPAEQPKAVQQPKPAEIRTVEWWRQPANEAAREAKIAECRKLPNPREDQNCANAGDAMALGNIGEGFAPVKEPTYRGFSVQPPEPK